MNAVEAIKNIRALFSDMPVPMPQEESKPEEVKVEMAEYILEDGTKVMISSLEVGGEVVLEDGSPAPDADQARKPSGGRFQAGRRTVRTVLRAPGKWRRRLRDQRGR